MRIFLGWDYSRIAAKGALEASQPFPRAGEEEVGPEQEYLNYFPRPPGF